MTVSEARKHLKKRHQFHIVFKSDSIDIVFSAKPIITIDIVLRIWEAFQEGEMGPCCAFKQIGDVG